MQTSPLILIRADVTDAPSSLAYSAKTGNDLSEQRALASLMPLHHPELYPQSSQGPSQTTAFPLLTVIEPSMELLI